MLLFEVVSQKQQEQEQEQVLLVVRVVEQEMQMMVWAERALEELALGLLALEFVVVELH